jgi:hypothetical protein
VSVVAWLISGVAIGSSMSSIAKRLSSIKSLLTTYIAPPQTLGWRREKLSLNDLE